MSFEQLAAQRGGIKHYSPESREQTLIDQMVSSVAILIATGRKNDRPMNLSVHTIDNMMCNAWTYSDENHDYIALNRGLFETIPKLYRALLSHSNLFPDIGPGDYGDPFRSFASPMEVCRDATLWEVPVLKNANREVLVDQLSELSIRYLFEHEFSHIYNGHLEWLQNQGKSPQISEVPTDGVLELYGVARQTLEFDADSGAVQRLLRYMLQPEIRLTAGIESWHLSDLRSFGGVQQTLIMAIIACQAITLLYQTLDNLSPDKIVSSIHPHPSIRSFILVSAVVNTVAFRTGVTFEDCGPAINSAVTQLIPAWIKVFPDHDDLLSILGSEFLVELFQQAIEAYTEQWASMHTYLDAAKRGGKLAPRYPVPSPAFPNHPEFRDESVAWNVPSRSGD